MHIVAMSSVANMKIRHNSRLCAGAFLFYVVEIVRQYTIYNDGSINQSKRKTSNANGQTNLGHKHKAPDHNHEATQPMVDLPHTS